MSQIQESYVREAEDLIAQGKTREAWEKLAEGSDNYAAGAANIIGDNSLPIQPSLMGNVVREYWNNQFGEGVVEEKWGEVGRTHIPSSRHLHQG